MRASAVDFRRASGSRPPGWGGCTSGVNTSLLTIKRANLEISEGNLSFYFFGCVSSGIFILRTPTTKLDTDENIETVRYL